MSLRRPIVAYTIGMYTDADGPGHCVYSEAYGLEMTIDRDWQVETILMSPPHLMKSMTEWADVPSMGITVGASYVPGNGNFVQISSNGGRWVLVTPEDDVWRVLSSNLGAILCIDTADQLPSVLDRFVADPEYLVVAFQTTSVTTMEAAQNTASTIRRELNSRNLEAARILVNGLFHERNVAAYAKLPSVDGVLMMDAQSSKMVRLIEIVAKAYAT